MAVSCSTASSLSTIERGSANTDITLTSVAKTSPLRSVRSGRAADTASEASRRADCWPGVMPNQARRPTNTQNSAANNRAMNRMRLRLLPRSVENSARQNERRRKNGGGLRGGGGAASTAIGATTGSGWDCGWSWSPGACGATVSS